MQQGRAQPLTSTHQKNSEDRSQTLIAPCPKWPWLSTCPSLWRATGNKCCYLSSCSLTKLQCSDSSHNPAESMHTSEGLSAPALSRQSYLRYIFKSHWWFISPLLEVPLQQFRTCTQACSASRVWWLLEQTNPKPSSSVSALL